MKKKLFALMMAMTMTVSLAACGGGKTETPAPSTETPAASGEAGGTFKLGTIGPLTGDAAIYGQAVANGAKIAVDEINAAGGAIQFEFQSQDDVADGEKKIQNLTDKYCKEIDTLAELKEKEIMEI